MESAMETNKDAKVVSKKKQNIMYSEVKAISHIGKKKYGTDDFETIFQSRFNFVKVALFKRFELVWITSSRRSLRGRYGPSIGRYED